METPNTHMHDRSLSWLGTGTSIKSDSVKLALWVQNSLNKMMQLCKYFPNVNKMIIHKLQNHNLQASS